MNYTKFMEALKGKQHKIDKNKNGKIDAHDFKLLRKEEVEELDEGVDPSEIAGNPKMYDAATVKKAYYHNSTTPEDKKTLERHLDRHHGMNNWRKPVKEETISEATVKTQKYSWGTMKTVHHGSDFSIPLHPEHHQAIAKLKDEQEHKFKDETGRHWTARRKGDDVHFQGANGGSSTKVPHSQMSEEVKDPTPVAPTLDRKYIKGTPEHKAYKATKKPINGHPTNNMKEEVEQIEEVNHREFAQQGKMHPDMAKHMKTGQDMDFYHSKTGDKISGIVKKNMGGEVHVKAHKDGKMGAGEVHKFTVSSKLDEVLKPSMGAGEYIKDFQKSDAPQFAGKSKEKRRVMGIAAYLQAKRNVKEEAEPVEEGLKDVAKKALKALTGGSDEDQRKDLQRKMGVPQTGKKPVKEAVSPVVVKVNHALEAPHEEEWEDTGICPEHNKKDCHECGKGSMKENTGKSYKEFMMMLEYESDKSGSYKHTGTYGSEYAKKEREKDEKGFDSENEPAKRGPKMGSKRGPKANLGSSKLHTK